LLGPALNLTSSDSSVTITPGGTSINLQATGGSGGSGVQYPASTTAYAVMGDSRAGVTSSCQESALPSDTAPITAGSVSGGTASFTGTNTWASGCITTLSGFTGGAAGLNGQLCVVSATGISGSAFQCPVTGGAIGSTGTGQAGVTYNLTGYLSREQYINGHGAVTNYATSSQTLAAAETAYATTAHTKSPAVTGNPGYLILEDWAQDILNGRTVAQIEADYSTLLTTARADNWTGIICTTMPALRASGYPLFVAPFQEWQSVNQWILSMTPTSTNIAAGAYCDRVVQLDDVLANGYDGTYFIQAGTGHPTDGGNRVAADKIVKAISNPSDLVEQNTAADFMLQGPFVSGDGPILGVSDGSGSGSNAAWGWALHQWSGTNIYPVYGFRPTSSGGGPLSAVMSIQGISGGYAHELGTANGYCWGAITPPTAPDTCFTRSTAGEIAAGQGGAAGDGTGGVKLSWLHTALSTANTGSCASGLGGQWSFGADGTVTRCPSGGGTWTAFGGGSFTAAGDLAGSSSTQEVVGIHSVPLCTGFTPTNSQVLTYTTASSPNPCWTAAAGGGGGSPAGSNYATQYNNGGSFGGTGPGTSGYVLTSNGSSAAPTYQPSSGGGTTTNALTANSSGGAAPGTTFNGSAARTFDYHSFGAAGISGTPTTGHCADWASATTLGDTGAACGSSLSLTTTGTSGAATYLGNIINIPQYQGAITLTTTGTSGAATLAGNTLNIPQYTGGVASINSQTGPAINIHSSDASVTVTTTTNDINLQVSGGSGCTATGAAGVAIVTDGSGHCIPATGSVSTGTGGTAAGVTLPEGTALTPTAGYDILNTNSSTHTLDLSTNGGAFSHVCTAANGYCAAASAGPQFKQYTYVADSTAELVTSPSLTIAAGDLLVVSCRFAPSTGSTGIATDSHSNSYSALAAQVNSPQAVGIQASWAIASASGATTFTCTQGGSAAGISLIALDYSNGTGTTVNTSSGGILSSFQTRITSPSYATSQRTLNVFCSAVNSISGFFDPLWIGGNSAQLVGASAAGVEIVGADQGCESIAIPYAVPGATANMQYSVSIYAAQTAVAFNY